MLKDKAGRVRKMMEALQMTVFRIWDIVWLKMGYHQLIGAIVQSIN